MGKHRNRAKKDEKKGRKALSRRKSVGEPRSANLVPPPARVSNPPVSTEPERDEALGNSRGLPIHEGAAERGTTGREQPASTIQQKDAAHAQKLSVFRSLYRGVLVAAALGYLADSLGWTEAFREREILGHQPGSPALGILLSAACLIVGGVFAAAHAIKGSDFWRAVVDLSGLAIVGGGLVLLAARGFNRTEAVPVDPIWPPVAQEFQQPDESDVHHLGRDGNVVRARPGETKKHRLLLRNQRETTWRNRQLCRETGLHDSRAVLSPIPCVILPEVAPRTNVPITLEIVAPLRPGEYFARWKMVDKDGAIAFPGAAPVVLKVVVE